MVFKVLSLEKKKKKKKPFSYSLLSLDITPNDSFSRSGVRKLKLPVQPVDNLQVVWFVLGGDERMANQEVDHDEGAVWFKFVRFDVFLHLGHVPEVETFDLPVLWLWTDVTWEFDIKAVLDFGLQPVLGKVKYDIAPVLFTLDAISAGMLASSAPSLTTVSYVDSPYVIPPATHLSNSPGQLCFVLLLRAIHIFILPSSSLT